MWFIFRLQKLKILRSLPKRSFLETFPLVERCPRVWSTGSTVYIYTHQSILPPYIRTQWRAPLETAVRKLLSKAVGFPYEHLCVWCIVCGLGKGTFLGRAVRVTRASGKDGTAFVASTVQFS